MRAADERQATLARLAEIIRHEALAIDPGLRYVGVLPIADAIDDQRRAWRLGVTLFAAFGALALRCCLWRRLRRRPFLRDARRASILDRRCETTEKRVCSVA